MYTWEYNSTSLADALPVATIHLPFCVQGVAFPLSTKLVLDTAQPNCFLYTSPEYDGLVFAKLSTEVTYLAVGEQNNFPSCYLGNLAAGTHQIDFHILFTSSCVALRNSRR